MPQTGIRVKLLLEHWSMSGAKKNKTTGMAGLIPAYLCAPFFRAIFAIEVAKRILNLNF
jgi:hypothetical protein